MPSGILANTYEIRQEIGSGGGGVVYLAWHLRLEKLVVLKADKRGVSANMEKLRREADALKSLSHSYIPQVYDFIVENGNVYTAMEYIEGESFDKLLRREQRFPQPMVVKWTRQLLEAVVYLHTRPPYGILHSDIKPANVMLTPAGDICLIDFNIALALGAEGVAAVGASRGYASPEHYGPEALAEATGCAVASPDPDKTVPVTGLESTMLLGAGSRTRLLDVRSDIYSMGATVYHILSGTRPAAKARDVTPLSKTAFSAGFVDIISKAMNPNPDLRYQTAAEMLDAVNRLHKNDIRYKRQVRNRYLWGAALSVLFLASGFSAFTGLKRMERAKEALVQAGYSADALAKGDLAAAVGYAAEAISTRGGIFAPPPLPQAKKALADALQVYDLSDGYKPLAALELPSPPLKIAVSPGEKLAAAVYAYEAAVFDPARAKVLERLPLMESALSDVVFTDDHTLVYAGRQGICCYDAAAGRELWRGAPATAIALSADGKTIAAVYRDEGEAILYSAEGRVKGTVSFQGKRQRILADDSFGDPEDALLCLNRDGSLLAASFADGSLDLFDLAGGETLPIQPPSQAVHFEGGFYGDYFAFSAAGGTENVFAAIDTRDKTQTGGFQADNPFGVAADESGVYVSSENLVVELDPGSGEQREAAYTSSDVTVFAHGVGGVIAGTDNGFELFDSNANPVGSCIMDRSCSFVHIGGAFALAGARDSPSLRILQKKDFSSHDFFSYDPAYLHDEARVNGAQDRILLFSYRGFRLCGKGGELICETSIPDMERVTDQQYSHTSGNLAVLYKDALRIYAGGDGKLLFEKTGLQSVFYAPYGVSILERDGTLSLIDIDTGKPSFQTQAEGDFAAFCGVAVDGAFLGGRELIGAAKTDDGYRFAVSDGVKGAVCDAAGKELFSFAARGKSEAFFAGDVVLISPQHGTPAAYRLKTGKKIRDLQPDSYLTYATRMGDLLLVEYITADGARFGVLLDSECEAVAHLPGLTDTAGSQMFFDYQTGYIRRTHLYSMEELRRLVPETAEAK